PDIGGGSSKQGSRRPGDARDSSATRSAPQSGGQTAPSSAKNDRAPAAVSPVVLQDVDRRQNTEKDYREPAQAGIGGKVVTGIVSGIAGWLAGKSDEKVSSEYPAIDKLK